MSGQPTFLAVRVVLEDGVELLLPLLLHHDGDLHELPCELLVDFDHRVVAAVFALEGLQDVLLEAGLLLVAVAREEQGEDHRVEVDPRQPQQERLDLLDEGRHGVGGFALRVEPGHDLRNDAQPDGSGQVVPEPDDVLVHLDLLPVHEPQLHEPERVWSGYLG